MAMSLAQAVEETVKLIYGNLDADDVETRYVLDAKRIEETSEMEPIAEAFARAEIDASDKGLGVYGANLIPAIGYQLRKKLDRGGEVEREAVSDAIKQALAAGFVAFISIEPTSGIEFVSGADHRRAWDLAVHNFRAEGLRRLGLPDAICKTVESIGEDAMKAGVRRAGLMSFRSGRVGLVGRYYGHAGGWMRAAQTDLEPKPPVAMMTAAMPDLWPYEQYVTGIGATE
jgi:hypothetical protein